MRDALEERLARRELPAREALRYDELQECTNDNGPENRRPEQAAGNAGGSEIAAANARCCKQQTRTREDDES